MLLGGTELWKLQVVPSTVHGLVKFPTEEGIAIVQSVMLKKEVHGLLKFSIEEGPPECSHVVHPNLSEPMFEERSSLVDTDGVVISEKNKDQKIKMGSEVPEALQRGLVFVLKEYTDIFAWNPWTWQGSLDH